MIHIQTRKLFFVKDSFWYASPQDIKGSSAAFFYACTEKTELPSARCNESKTWFIDLSADLETLKQNMAKGCRYDINRAAKEELIVKKNTDQQAFFDMYSDFVKSKVFSGDLDSYWKYIENGTLYTCYWQEQLIAGLLVIQDERHARWILSGSKRLEMHDKTLSKKFGYANRLLIWEAIQDAKQCGRAIFDLGGYSDTEDRNDPEYRIAQFKRGFGGQAVTLYKYQKIYSPLLKLLKSLKKRLQSS
ncbi:hypothetical protein [Bacterioplanoides sp.]|uniref:hypothetical protein n=1 Tax=Bacterioplanoides sp. TaxID=2066072 RepID=UPI003AFFD1D9